MRDDANKVLILLTDGVQNPKTFDPVKQAKRLRARGIQVITVGITNEIDEKQLLDFAGTKDNVFFAENFDELDSSDFVDKLGGKMCEVAEKPDVAPTSGGKS